MIDELDRVALTAPVSDHIATRGLTAGDVGTVMAVHDGGCGYTVEFLPLTGETISIKTLSAATVRPVQPREIAHARAVA
jgi:hypothetical protein